MLLVSGGHSKENLVGILWGEEPPGERDIYSLAFIRVPSRDVDTIHVFQVALIIQQSW